jgi:hypothetical protein
MSVAALLSVILRDNALMLTVGVQQSAELKPLLAFWHLLT